MAQSVHLAMTANGNAVEGESTIASLDRDKTIECFWFKHRVLRETENNRRLTGKPVVEELGIIKRIDKSSPLLQKALDGGEVVEGRFEFFRSNPAGDGTVEHFFTIRIDNAHIVNIDVNVWNVLGQHSAVPALEYVWFAPGEITYTYESNGAEHTTKFFEEKK